jgi:GST-like protein
MMESQLTPGRYLLGDELTVLDLYVAVVSRWGPRRKRFYEVAPRMSEVVKRVDADPRLADVLGRAVPVRDGWESQGATG